MLAQREAAGWWTESARSLYKERIRPGAGHTYRVANMEALTVAELSELFGVAPTTVRRWIRDGWLPALRVRGRLMVARAQVVRQFFTLMTDPHASTRRERKRMHDSFVPAVTEMDELVDAALKRAEAPALRRAHRRGWRLVGEGDG